MNEPHDMSGGTWKTISQAVVEAIRANQDDKLILVPGDSWSSANRWVQTHGALSWINDPSNNFAYEAHQYFDRDESGRYAVSYDAELARNPDLANVGSTRVSHFLDWCRSNHVRGIVDEYGIPNTDTQWAAVLDNFLMALDAAGMDGVYWAAGEWWGNYALSVQPSGNFTVDRPQMSTLQAHLGGGYLTALSAASASVARAAPGSLVTVYGDGFTAQTAQATATPWPAALADITVRVTDASGVAAPAGLLYVSPGQINLQMPALSATGRATITVQRGGSTAASGTIQLAARAPAIFTANGAGYGAPAAQVVRVKADSSVTYESAAAPIDLGPDSDRLFLALYGTGVRCSAVSLSLGIRDVPVQSAGPQGQFPGLDQINVGLPRSLAGQGQTDIALTCDGIRANGVTVTFQ
jgi:uncharacterized protein (TIGR03437 family)